MCASLFVTPVAKTRSDRINQIRELKSEKPSLINAYLTLMEKKKLLNQLSNKLKKRRLLKKDGGLCAFTAMVDAFEAFSEYYKLARSKFIKRPDYFLYQIIDEARNSMDADPAYEGIELKDLVTYTSAVIEKYGLESIVQLNFINDPKEIDPDKLNPDGSKIRLLGVTSKDGKEGHTMVMLGIDTKKKVFFVSDPNYPNKVLTLKYRKLKKGLGIYLDKKDFPGFQPSYIEEIVEVSIHPEEPSQVIPGPDMPLPLTEGDDISPNGPAAGGGPTQPSKQ